MDGGGHFTGLHDGELQVLLLRRRGVDDEGGFTGAEHRELAHLAGLIGEVGHLLGIVQDHAQGLDVAGLLDGLHHRGQHGLVGIARLLGTGRDLAQHAAVGTGLEDGRLGGRFGFRRGGGSFGGLFFSLGGFFRGSFGGLGSGLALAGTGGFFFSHGGSLGGFGHGGGFGLHGFGRHRAFLDHGRMAFLQHGAVRAAHGHFRGFCRGSRSGSLLGLGCGLGGRLGGSLRAFAPGGSFLGSHERTPTC